MAKQRRESGQVVIRLDSKLFYGLVGGVAFVLALSVVFYLGMRLGQRGQQPATVQQSTNFQQPGVSQSGDTLQLQPGQNQQQLSNPQVVSQVRQPVGDDVPIGNNPRLALPDLAETDYVYDFGKVPPDEVVETSVKVENKGTQPLVIKSVRGSCGCTVANTGKDTIPPDESTDLRVTYDPTYNNDAGKQITRQVIVESNDPKAPVVEFTIRADVQDK